MAVFKSWKINTNDGHVLTFAVADSGTFWVAFAGVQSQLVFTDLSAIIPDIATAIDELTSEKVCDKTRAVGDGTLTCEYLLNHELTAIGPKFHHDITTDTFWL